MRTIIGLSESHIEEVVMQLNSLLAFEYALYTKTRNAHWNVDAPVFQKFHKHFEEQFIELDTIIDNIATRVRSLGHFAMGSLKDILSVTKMAEENYDFSNPMHIINVLVNDHEAIIRIIKNEINSDINRNQNLGISGFVTNLMEKHEKMVWMLKSLTV